jgi:quercetin dioxygenase-like cupin family protein
MVDVNGGQLEVTPLDAIDAEGDGVAWSASPEGVNVNLVVLGSHSGISLHRNDEVDVLIVVLAGGGTLLADAATHPLAAGDAVMVPRGTERALDAGPTGLRYLTIHRARGALRITDRAQSDPWTSPHNNSPA